MSVGDVEEAVFAGHGGQYLVEVVAVRVGNKYLSEVLARYEFDDLFDTGCVQLVEYVVEK